jgi:hypothetical protein
VITNEVNIDMKKIAALALLIVVVLVATAAVIYFRSSQIATNPTPNATPTIETSTTPLPTATTTAVPTISPNIKITNFSFTGYYNPVNLEWNYQFHVQVQNQQTSIINGATLTFDIQSNYTITRQIVIGEPTVRYLPPGEQYLLGTIGSGEKITVNGFIENNLADDAKLRGSTFVAILKVNNTVLDEKSMIL